MNRRDWLLGSGGLALASGVTSFPASLTAATTRRKQRVLMYTKSEGFEHPVVRRNGSKLSLAETIAIDLGRKNGFEVQCEKDGRIFLSETLKNFDGFLFQTQGDLLKEKSVDGFPPMPADGKQALLRQIAEGKGFVGCHCASDTFHSKGHYEQRWLNQPKEDVDPYIRMVGGEFAGHGEQQRAWLRVVDPNFPGIKGVADFGLIEEWYSLKNFNEDMHVILVLETRGMRNFDYERPNFPATWARMHEKGRVFFTCLGHREDVWTNPLFHQILLGGLAWALGNVEADVSGNFTKVTPLAQRLPRDWVQLFNRRDLTGWKTHPSDKAHWEVVDGILQAKGPHVGHLFTERDDYTNFQYRIEAKINDKGNSGQYFRVKYGPSYPKGYEAQINSTHPDPQKTGSLWGFVPVGEALVKPDEWFTQEVTAIGNHIVIKVNGKTTVDFRDTKNTYHRGHLALQMHGPTNNVETHIQFRKIEVRELGGDS